jgi:hypothetical protein
MSDGPGAVTLPSGAGARGRADLLCVLGLVLLPFLLFWPVTLGLRVFAQGDLFTYNYPLLHVTAEQWKEGRVPLWNPYIFGGTPLLAAIQGGVFYPPNALLLLKPLWLWFGYSILLQYSLCGVFGFLYLRQLDLSPAAAVTGALVYAFAGFTMGHLGHVGMLRTIPWLPLVLWGFEGWRREGSARHLAAGALAVGLMVVAGHPQVPFYALVVASTYALYFAVVGEPGERRRALVGLLLALAAGAAVGGVQLVPTAEALREDYVRDGGGTYEYFTLYSFPPSHLPALLFPRLMRVPLIEMSGYVGIAPLVLAVVGALGARGPQDRHRRYYVGLAVASLLLVLGRYNPIYPLLYRLPLYNSFRIPSRNWFEFTIAAAVLAALGIDFLRNNLERAGRVLRWTLAGVGLTAVVIAVAAVARGGLGGAAVWPRVPFLAATLLLLGWVAARPRASRHPGVAVALPVLVAADLFSFGSSLYRQYEPSVYTRPPEALQFLQRQDGPFRILTIDAHKMLDPFREALAPDSNATVGVESLGGHDVLVLRHITPASAGVSGASGVILRAPPLRWRRFKWFMDLLNTRFVVASRGGGRAALDPERYRKAYENESVVVYENLQALPRLFWVPRVRTADRWAGMAALKSGRVGDDVFDPRRSALVEVPRGVTGPDPTLATPPGDSNAELRSRVEILDLQPGEVRVRLESPADGLLVHGTNMASGWMAAVDGARVPVYRTDGFVQGVIVPAGSHVVEFRYAPVSFVVGAATSLAGLGLVGAVLAWPTLLRRAGAVPPEAIRAASRTDAAPG